jgi:hypothetical protein
LLTANPSEQRIYGVIILFKQHTQALQGLDLDLAYTFARHAKIGADFFQCRNITVVQPKTPFYYLALFVVELAEPSTEAMRSFSPNISFTSSIGLSSRVATSSGVGS